MAKMTKRFPLFVEHDRVACFMCGTGLAEARSEDSGHAPGNGQFRKHLSTVRPVHLV